MSNHVNISKEFKSAVNKLKEEAENLNSLFWTEKELQQLQIDLDFLEVRIQSMMKATLGHFKLYQEEGWKKFND